MASITLTIPDAISARVLDGFAAATGYSPTVLVDGVPVSNTETKAQYAKRMLIEYIRGQVVSHEVSVAVATAADSARATSNAEISIT